MTNSPATLAEVRSGAYYDSVVLMQLQRALAALPGVEEAGVVMGTPANKELLAQSDLLTAEVQQAAPEDLILVARGETQEAARAALAQVDDLLARRRSQSSAGGYRPKTLASAAKMLPQADWVLVSVPGRYAAGVAREALELAKNVFLYSDNVPLEDEIALKKEAAANGLLLMGPDCGTALIDGAGLGFANRVRRGSVGIVAASGTGLQAVSVGIHRLGGGVSQAYGTGGRDLSAAVGGATARQALARLAENRQTDVIVLISKPPEPSVAAALLKQAAQTGKPVVVNFIGLSGKDFNAEAQGVHFAATLDEAAEMAVGLTADARRLTSDEGKGPRSARRPSPLAKPVGFLRGLYSGGTLAYEALFLLQGWLPDVQSNVPLPGGRKLENPHRSAGHAVIDLGADEFTVGRLHPMLDNELRVQRLLAEAEDPQTGVLLLDVVLGDGAHPDPAAELAPAIQQALAGAANRSLAVVAVVTGTDADPQGLDGQIERLEAAGAVVFTRHDQAVRAVGRAVGRAVAGEDDGPPTTDDPARAENAIRNTQYAIRSSSPFAAVNVGLESFSESLRAQGAEAVQVDWRPPAGGNERLAGLLARMRGE